MGLLSTAAGSAGVALALATATADSMAAVLPPVPSRALCAPVPAGRARCLSEVVTDRSGAPLATSSPAGFGPADIRSAYSLEGTSQAAGSGHTIAVVAAYDNPTAESDLATYRTFFGLPPCTTANGCFTKRDQRGGVAYPRPDSGWGGEIALDLDMASAACPNCRLMLVEASSDAISDAGAAVDQAAALGATEISNSYGSLEYGGELQQEGHYNHPGIALTAASGDDAYGVQFPAASRYVTAVGGTSLVRADDPRGWAETAWGGAGSGCSAYVPKPPRQADQGCGNRSVADVSAVADPTTGVAVFHTDGNNPAASGWTVFGGTSVSAPIVAGIYAVKGHGDPADPFGDLAPFFDVTSGANGSCGSYLCQAGPGFDGPTGMGSPNGGQTAPARPAPPTQAPSQPQRSPSASGAASPPKLTKKKAALYTRRALSKSYGRRFKRRRNYRVSCRRGNRVTMTCRVSWRSGRDRYAGSVTVKYAVDASGRVQPQASPAVRRASRAR